MNQKIKNKKKKGFTLVELIAVIAILGILSAIVAVNVMGYNDRAKIGKAKTNAKQVLDAIQTYNTDHDGDSTFVEADTWSNTAAGTTCVPASNRADYIKTTVASALGNLTRAQLENVSNGKGASSGTTLTASEAATY
ncbi:MAG: prepilin-type N-terminal cleavage/methylation domain-containing protein [Bacillota bacterium]|nr:prepilin-type N-terminal cleavage/methylation domain-containing protein [Bacillota bacterium]